MILFPSALLYTDGFQKIPFVTELKTLLNELPNLAHNHFVPSDFTPTTSCIEIFTDGSCVHPTRPNQRIATWGVVIWHNNSFSTVAEGGVPGFHQTSLRGEIWAAVAALSFAVQQNVQIRLWIDNQTVCNFLQRLISDTIGKVNPQGKDADLWEWLQRQFENARTLVKQVVKVRSHVGQDAQDEFEAWVFQGNDSADKAAKQARANIPQRIWGVWHRVVETDLQNDNLRQAIHTLFVKVGMKSVQSQPKTKPPEPCGTNQNETVDVDQNLIAISQTGLDAIPPHFLVDETSFLLEWLGTILTGNSPARWVTWHQLLIDYQFVSGREGPRNIGRRWRNVGYRHSDYSFCAHAKWFFSHYFQNLGKSLSLRPEVKTMRAASHVLTYWGGSVRVKISSERLDRVDSFLKEWATRTPARNITRDLGEVPRAKP